MSFHVYFDFSMGLCKTLLVPKGTTAKLVKHVETVEKTLGLKRATYSEGKERRVHWEHWDPAWREGFPDIDDKTLCRTAEEHNLWVRWVYDRFEEWSKAPVIKGGEKLTPKKAQQFWHGLRRLTVPPARWTPEYFRARMEALYEAMRGRDGEGAIFDAKPLTPKQASAVINIFDQYLDVGDLRLEVPRGRDHLLPSGAHEGGYDWCEHCGAIDPYDGSCRRRKCPVREERAA